jgi:hypothetical protein
VLIHHSRSLKVHVFAVAVILGVIGALPTTLYGKVWTDAICKPEGGEYICLGIDRNRGGAVTYLTTHWSTAMNLVDNGPSDTDNGRQIQASIYREGEFYDQSCWACNAGCFWGWNAVQAGSCSPNQDSSYYYLAKTSSTMFIQTQPKHWDTELGTSNFYIGTYYELISPRVIRVTYQLWNDEPISTGNQPHELPVVYLEPHLGVAMSYIGSSPFSGDSVSTIGVPVNGSLHIAPTERWTGWFWSVSGQGVALYVPEPPYQETWTLGRITSHSDPTHYIQNWAHWNLSPGTPYSRTVYIVVGTVSEVREAVYSLEGY